MNRLAALPLVLFACLLFAVGVAVPASAHTQLIGVDPAEGATVAADSTVTLSFSEDLLAIGAEATVTDSAGVVTSLEVAFPSASTAQLVFPAMASGDLTVAWRVVANDGHPVEGTLAYVAAAPLPPSPAPPSPAPSSPAHSTPGPTASATPSAAATASPDATASPSAAPSAAEVGSSGFNNVALWVAIFAALLASSVAIFAAKRRR